MKRTLDLRTLEWVHAPSRYLVKEDRVIIETEPFSDLRPTPYDDMEEAMELELVPRGNFNFTCRVDFDYTSPFDQCGMILYHNGERKAVCGTEKRNGEVLTLAAIVYYEEGGDRSEREIGSSISWMYYRVWKRGRCIRFQYSFNGTKYSDLRSFVLRDDGPVHIGIYACSPKNNRFDCTFSHMELNDEN